MSVVTSPHMENLIHQVAIWNKILGASRDSLGKDSYEVHEIERQANAAYSNLSVEIAILESNLKKMVQVVARLDSSQDKAVKPEASG